MHLNLNPLIQNTQLGETIKDSQGEFRISYKTGSDKTDTNK